MLAWLCLAVAVAQTADVPEEVIVTAPRRLSEAIGATHRALRARGYVRVLRLGQRSIYLHPQLWRPRVMVHDQGFARISRGPPVLPAGASIERLEWGAEPTEVYTTHWVVQSRRKRAGRKRDLALMLSSHLRAIRDVHVDQAQAQRRLVLRDQLVEIWFDGHTADGTAVPTYRARRHAIFDLWCHTTPGASGAEVRDAIERFVDKIVQRSDHPYSAWELAWLDQKAGDHVERFSLVASAE